MSYYNITKNYASENNQKILRYWDELKKSGIDDFKARCYTEIREPKSTRERIDIFKNIMYFKDQKIRIIELIKITEENLFTKELDFVFEYRRHIRNEKTLDDVPFHKCGLFRWMSSQNPYKFDNFKTKLRDLLFDFAKRESTKNHFLHTIAYFIAKSLANNFIKL